MRSARIVFSIHRPLRCPQNRVRFYSTSSTGEAFEYYENALNDSYDGGKPEHHINKGFALLTISSIHKNDALDEFKAAEEILEKTGSKNYRDSISCGKSKVLLHLHPNLFYYIDKNNEERTIELSKSQLAVLSTIDSY